MWWSVCYTMRSAPCASSVWRSSARALILKHTHTQAGAGDDHAGITVRRWWPHGASLNEWKSRRRMFMNSVLFVYRWHSFGARKQIIGEATKQHMSFDTSSTLTLIHFSCSQFLWLLSLFVFYLIRKRVFFFVFCFLIHLDSHMVDGVEVNRMALAWYAYI